MERYWRETMLPARDLGAWADTLTRLPLALAWQLGLLALPLLVLGLVALARLLREPGPRALPRAPGRLVRVASILALLHLLAWPLFFHAAIGARFVLPGLAMLAVLLWASMGAVVPAALGPESRVRGAVLAAVLLIPAAVAGDAPGKLHRLATWGRWNVATFVREGPLEWRLLHDMWSIDRDRRERRTGAGFGDAASLVDVRAVYLLEGASLVAGGLEYQWQRQRAACAFELLLRLDVRYVFARTGRLDDWEPELRPLAAGLRALSPAGRAFALDRSFLERHAAGPECRAVSQHRE
jgi:hypothetical protein